MAVNLGIPKKKKQYKPRKNALLYFDNDHFCRRYRLTKLLVAQLSQQFLYSGFCSTTSYQGGGLNHEERMCLALRYFATGPNCSLVGDFHGVSKSTVSRAVHEVIAFFESVRNQFIRFPRTWLELEGKAQAFYNMAGGGPLCVAAVDGTHIPIITPSVDEFDFVNRKGYHSLNAMVAVDAEKRITYLNARFPGSVHDSYVLKASKLWRHCVRGRLGDFFMLGDSGYPSKEFLFTPILNPASRADHNYNRWHAQTRSVVEQTIGLLKQRFRCLDGHGGYLYHSPNDSHSILTACVCLHNICLNKGIEVPGEEPPEPDARRPNATEALAQPPHMHILEAVNAAGRARRDQYVRNVFEV